MIWIPIAFGCMVGLAVHFMLAENATAMLLAAFAALCMLAAILDR